MWVPRKIIPTSQPSVASAPCPNITAADNAQPAKRRRNLKRTYAQSEQFRDTRCAINQVNFWDSERGVWYVADTR